MTGYVAALVVTLAVEVPLVALFYPGQRARMTLVATVATAATHLFMHFALPNLVSSSLAWLLLGEWIALSVEAGAYLFLAERREPGRAIAASAVANAASYTIGILVL